MAARRYKLRIRFDLDGRWGEKDIQCDVLEQSVTLCPTGSSTLITIEPTVCANATDPQLLVVLSDVEGVDFYGVDDPSPTTATAAATATWTLNPVRAMTDSKSQVWSASSKYAVVVSNSTGYDANITVVFGRN